MSGSRLLGSILSIVVAVVATALLPDSLPVSRVDWQGWSIVSPLAVVAAWLAAWAWLGNRRYVAVTGHLVSLLAPWGYLYPFTLTATALAIAAAFILGPDRSALTNSLQE
jgi:hypothetical protein